MREDIKRCRIEKEVFNITDKRDTDKWNENAADLQEKLESQRQEFVRNVAQRREGISSDRAKYVMDLHTGSQKIYPSNKKRGG